MRQLQQQHRQTRLPNPAADGLRHFAAQQRLMPLQLQTIFITGQRQLAHQRIGIYADTHRGKLKRIFQHRVPHQDIAVQTGVAQLRCGAPVIIIRRAYIMAVAIAQFTADPHQENGAKFFGDRAFAPFRIQIRETRQQFLTVNKLNLLWQERRQTKLFMHFCFRRLNSCPYSLYCAFQGGKLALAIAHDTLPVPLIHIDRVERRESVFIGAKGFHVRVQPFARAEVMLPQGLTFPLRQ